MNKASKALTSLGGKNQPRRVSVESMGVLRRLLTWTSMLLLASKDVIEVQHFEVMMARHLAQLLKAS